MSPVEIIEAPSYELDAELRQALTVRAGGSIRLFVTIKGRPTPKATWTKENGLPEHRCSIDITSSYRLTEFLIIVIHLLGIFYESVFINSIIIFHFYFFQKFKMLSFIF